MRVLGSPFRGRRGAPAVVSRASPTSRPKPAGNELPRRQGHLSDEWGEGGSDPRGTRPAGAPGARRW